jgi:hypothetical protein
MFVIFVLCCLLLPSTESFPEDVRAELVRSLATFVRTQLPEKTIPVLAAGAEMRMGADGEDEGSMEDVQIEDGHGR